MPWFRYRGAHKPASTQWDNAADVTTSPAHGQLESLFAWERRCRGYLLFGEPVALEPSFAAFDPRYGPETWDTLEQEHQVPPPLAYISLLLPVDQEVTTVQLGTAWSALRGLRYPLALEIAADSRSIRYQVACAKEEAGAVVAAFQMAFPAAKVEASRDVLRSVLRPIFTDSEGQKRDLNQWDLDWQVVDFGLGQAATRPLRLLENLSSDAHSPLMGILGGLEDGEVAGVQLRLQSTIGPWSAALTDWLEQLEGLKGADRRAAHPGTRDTELQRALRYKTGTPLWAASFRVFAVACAEKSARRVSGNSSHERAFSLCQRVNQALSFIGEPARSGVLTNELLALDDNGYHPGEQLADLLERRGRRSGMLLSQAELAGLWHPPAPSLLHPRLLRHDPHSRELPDHLREATGAALGTLFGPENPFGSGPNSQREVQMVPWPDAYRNRHFYMLGATRMGKSTLLHNMVVQDLWAGRGLCLIDPHGDLAHDILATIPPEREEDVLFLDLSDTQYPPALGLLQAGSEWEKRLLVSDLLSILHRVFASSWGDRLEHILRHALLTLLADDGQGAPIHTLRDIRPLLADEAYREDLLQRLEDPDLRSFWSSEFSGYSSSAFAPIYNKLGLLLSSPVVRNIVAGRESKLDPAELIRERRVLIVNLAGSLIGQDNAHFLGALLVSKIQLAAMHGLRHGQSQRVPFSLYVDEFQNFVVSSFESILSEAGKAGLSLVMANQFLEQLGEALQSAILSNVGTLVSFRVSAPSGRRLEGEFGGLFGAKELTDLERGQAVIRLGKAGDSFALRTFAPVTPAEVGATSGAADRVIAQTRDEVCRSRFEVEAELRDDEARLQALRAAWQAEQDAKKRGAKAKTDPDSAQSNTAKSNTAHSETPPSDARSATRTRAKATSKAKSDEVKSKATAQEEPTHGYRSEAEPQKATGAGDTKEQKPSVQAEASRKAEPKTKAKARAKAAKNTGQTNVDPTNIGPADATDSNHPFNKDEAAHSASPAGQEGRPAGEISTESEVVSPPTPIPSTPISVNPKQAPHFEGTELNEDQSYEPEVETPQAVGPNGKKERNMTDAPPDPFRDAPVGFDSPNASSTVEDSQPPEPSRPMATQSSDSPSPTSQRSIPLFFGLREPDGESQTKFESTDQPQQAGRRDAKETKGTKGTKKTKKAGGAEPALPAEVRQENAAAEEDVTA